MLFCFLLVLRFFSSLPSFFLSNFFKTPVTALSLASLVYGDGIIVMFCFSGWLNEMAQVSIALTETIYISER